MCKNVTNKNIVVSLKFLCAVCVVMCAQVCTHMEARQEHCMSFFITFHLIFEAVSVTEPEAHFTSLGPVNSQDTTVSNLQHLWLQILMAMTSFGVEAGNWNSRSHAFRTCSLTH